MHHSHHGASERPDEASETESDSTLTLVLDLPPRPRPAGFLAGVVGLDGVSCFVLDFRACCVKRIAERGKIPAAEK